MKTFLFAALAALTLGIGAANAAAPRTNHAPSTGDQYNWMNGGGG